MLTPLPLLHITSEADSLWTAWHADPLILSLLTFAAAAYLLAYRSAERRGLAVPSRRRVYAYLTGLVSLGIALLGPPDHFNGVLFSVHMVQHLLLMIVAAPLLVAGRPGLVIIRGLRTRHRRAVMRNTLGRHGLRQALSFITHPLVAFLVYNCSFVIWHLPGPYQAAVRNELIHELEHAFFFGSALLFWWVLFDGEPGYRRVSTTTVALSIFATWMIDDLLCATITLMPELLYPIYGLTEKPWGLTALGDQRLGGVIMWAGSGVFYAGLLIAVLARPYLQGRLRTSDAPASTTRPVGSQLDRSSASR